MRKTDWRAGINCKLTGREQLQIAAPVTVVDQQLLLSCIHILLITTTLYTDQPPKHNKMTRVLLKLYHQLSESPYVIGELPSSRSSGSATEEKTAAAPIEACIVAAARLPVAESIDAEAASTSARLSPKRRQSAPIVGIQKIPRWSFSNITVIANRTIENTFYRWLDVSIKEPRQF